MKKFPELYKKTSTGAIQYWRVWVEEKFNNGNGAGIIHIEYGQKDTPNPQHTQDTILSGKNLGKKNATTTIEQAYLEAKSKWEKQKKKGYVEQIDDATAGNIDDLIEGGILPMLAHSYDKQGHKIVFPCYVQPKLDGHRCIAIIKDGKCTLWSRTRKQINSMPHIIKELEDNFNDCTLDGELYDHKFKNSFEYISHLVRQEEPDPKHTDVKYFIYDVVEKGTFETRYYNNLYRDSAFDNLLYCVLVSTQCINSINDIKLWFDKLINNGYEGLILRNSNGLYVNKRSYDLQKVKEFEDAEFKIVDIKEGKGKLRGHVGSFTCWDHISRTTFDVKMSGDTDKLKEYFNNDKLWRHKMLTVQYQGRTGAAGVPRFPVGLRMREDI